MEKSISNVGAPPTLFSKEEEYQLIMESKVGKELNQIRALAYKSMTLQWKQYKSNVCQLLFPVLCLLVILVLQLVANSLISDATEGLSETKVNATAVELSQIMYQAKTQSSNLTFNPPESLYFTSDKTGYLESIGFGHLSYNMTPSTGFLKSFSPRLKNPFFLVNGTFDHLGYISVPYSVTSPFGNETSMDEVLYERMGAGGKAENLDAVGAYVIKSLTSSGLNYTIQFDYNEDTQFITKLLRTGSFKYVVTSARDMIGVSLQNWMNDAYLRKLTGSFRIRTYTAQMDYVPQPVSFKLADALGAFFFPMILSLLLPNFTFTIVMEKQFKLREMMKLMGMKMKYYFMVTYLFFFGLYIISSALFIIFSIIFDFRFITQTNPLILAIFFILWGNALISFAFFISSLIGNTVVATIVSYLMVLISPIVGLFLERSLYPNSPDSRYGILLFLPFQISEFVYTSSSACNQGQCLVELSNLYTNNAIYTSLLYMLGSSIVYFTLGLYLDAILPQTFGIRKHPLFFLEWLWKPCVKHHVRRRKGSLNQVTPSEVMDSDVSDEFNKINPLNLRNEEIQNHVNKLKEENGVVFYNLEKNFGGNRAVKGTCLTIGKSECFGLLGLNGAGKSTTISMLAGTFGPSSGTAFVYGKDIRYDMDSIHEVMGLTAQFDILYPDLSCEDHLLFYSRLKGVKIKHEKQHVQSLLRQVGLDNQTLKVRFSPASKSLSGGMKRRLSIAISLIGDPKVILLDEPTTGLDPLSKRHLWDIILQQKKNRTVILTTHSMDEADVLCDRMTIMVNGSFKCLGSGLRLKNKFGDGYLLTISYKEENRQMAEQFVYQYIPQAAKDMTLTGMTIFKIPHFTQGDSKSLASLFKYMENGKELNGIEEWSLNQVSLEQVFLNIIASNAVMKRNNEVKSKKFMNMIKQCLF